MKTVKQGSTIDRMSDAKAAKAVEDGWAYCPKKEWKKLRDGDKPVANKDVADNDKKGKSSPKKGRKKEKNIAQS